MRTQHPVFNFSEVEATMVNQKYLDTIVGACHDSGKSFISVNNDRVDGFCLAMVLPNVWIPARKELQLLAVKGDNDFVASKMFIKFMKLAKAGLEAGEYRRILVDKLPTTNINYEKLGFEELKVTYTMER